MFRSRFGRAAEWIDSGAEVLLAVLPTKTSSHPMRSRLPFELWLGRGLPLNPYLRGVIIDFLRKEMRPRDLRLIPDDVFSRPEDKELFEWSTLRVWVRDWLRYCRWYYGTALNDQVTIEDLFNAPVVNRNVQITRSDPQLQRFGLLWKVYDMVALKRLDWKVPILPEPSGSLPEPCLLGGVTGTDYLVVARGTNQPRAGRGVIYPGLGDDFGKSRVRLK